MRPQVPISTARRRLLTSGRAPCCRRTANRYGVIGRNAANLRCIDGQGIEVCAWLSIFCYTRRIRSRA
jgi:hypothetical protein